MSAIAAAEQYLLLTQELERGKFDARDACTPVGHGATGDTHARQLAAVLDPARFIVACLPRRSGKTMFEAIRAVLMCLSKPNAVVWYLSFTISYGVDTFTDGCLRGLLKRFEITADVREGGAYIEFPNGSTISVRGIDDMHSIEKLRGRNPPDLVFLDEVQSMRERVLQPVVDNIIRPTLLDRAGTLIVTGTPSPVPAGFFYKIWTEGKWSRHHWSLFDNPSKSRAYYEAFLAKEREDRGVTEADPAYRREWLGEWAIEESLRVYKYGPLNDLPAQREDFALKNGITGTRVTARHHLMTSHQAPLWRHAVGVDIGSGDRTSIVVLGQHLHDQHVFERYEWTIHRKQEPVQSDVIAQLKFIQREYNPMHYFFDSGGAGGKLFMTTIQRDYGFPFVEAARKTDRRGQIDSVNTWFRKGLLLVPAVSLAAEDAMRTIWDADKLKSNLWEYSPTWHPDPMEALRYCATGIYAAWFEQKNLKSQRERMIIAESQALEAELVPPARNGLVQGNIEDMIELEAEDAQAFGQGGWTGW